MATIHRLAPPVPAAGGLPAGVSVHEFGTVPERHQPRNALEQAAMQDDMATAIAFLQRHLSITSDTLAKANLPHPNHWRRLIIPGRLQIIAEWLRAECFELMDHVSFDRPTDMTIGD